MPFIRNSNFITPIHSYSCRHSAGEGFVSPSFTSSDYYRLCRTETYSYDSSDRLIQVNRGNSVYQTMEYDVNGNILSKTDVGTYNYDTDKRHAVTSIDVTDSKYRPGEQSVTYNFFGKVETIGEWNGDKYHELNITYGPDMERCKSVLTTNYEEKRTIIYSDSYECVTENGQTREFYYIGENVILVRQTGKSDIVCHAITDNQGSILCIVDDDGKRLFEAAYDAWGKQEKITNTIGFLRGYTGHEMLPEFGLINMNHLIKREQSELACYAERENGRMKFSGRIYDPTLGRFLSPDNYVQMPDNTQSFNRYSYCINNPLKYVDPSGQWFGIDDLLIAGMGFVAGYLSNALTSGNWGWNSVKAGACSAVSSWLGFNTAGLATGTITTATFQTGMNIGLNTLINSFLPPLNVPITDNFGLSFFALCGIGNGGISVGVGCGVSYTNGDFSVQTGVGFGKNYIGWNASASYKGYGGSFGKTYYEGGMFHGQEVGKQTLAHWSIAAGDVSFTMYNDLWGDGQDRWRISAAELSIGKFSVGTYVDTNWGKYESPGKGKEKIITGKDVLLGEGNKWKNGKVYSAPVWVGYRSNNISYRVGYSHPYVQSLTQNFVHKYVTPTPYFLNYETFEQGIYSYSGNHNPFTLWNY